MLIYFVDELSLNLDVNLSMNEDTIQWWWIYLGPVLGTVNE